MSTPLRVLLVEETEQGAALLLRHLEKEGYQVVSARVINDVEMQAAIDDHPWDIITSEYQLSQFNALAALWLLQNSSRNIPFIVISDNISDANAVELMRAGAQDYLSKAQLSRLTPIIERELTQTKKRKNRLLAENSVRESEEKFRLLVSQSPNGIMVLDNFGAIIEWNHAQEIIFLTPRAEVIGKPAWEVQFEFLAPERKTPEMLEGFKTELQTMLNTGNSPHLNKYLEYPVVLKNQTQRWIGTHTFSIHTREGSVTVTSFVDITEQKLGEKQLTTRSEEINILYRASQELSRTLDFEQLAHTLFLQISMIMDCDTFFIASYDDQKKLIHCIYGNVENNRVDTSQFPDIPLEEEGHGTQSRVIRSGHSWMIEDFQSEVKNSATTHYVHADGKVDEREDLPKDEEVTRSGIILPMIFKGKCLGAIQILSYRLNAYTREHLNLAEALSAQFGTAYNNALLYREAQNEIAERKRAETALQESDQRFSKAFEYAINGMTLTSLDGRWLKVNRAVCEMVGYSEQELLSADFQDITHPDDLKADAQFHQQLLSGEIDYFKQIQKRYIHKDGHLVWVLMNMSVVRDDNSAPLYFISQISNISDLKQIEETLHLQSTAIENSANAVSITNREGVIEWTNPAWTELTGYTSAETVGKTFRILKSGLLSLAYYQNLWAVILSGKVFQSEIINKHKDGSMFTCFEIITPVFGEDGLISHFVAILQDITERKQSEEALRMSEESHRSILQMAMDGYWKVNVNGILLDVNEAYARMSGYSRQELIGMPISNFETVNHYREAMAHISDVIEKGQDRFETRHRTKDGREYDVEISIQYQPNQDGWITAFVRDITQSKLINDALRDSEQKLKTLFELLPVGVSVQNDNGNIVYMNPALESILGISRDSLGFGELSSLPFLRSDGTPMPPNEFAPVRAVMEQRSITNVETGIQKGANLDQVTWMNISSMPVDFSDWQVINVISDITANKQAEQALRESEKRLHQALDAAKGGTWDWDLQTDENIWSEELWKVYHLEPFSCQPNYNTWLNTIHPEDRASVAQTAREATQNGIELNAEWRVLDQSGNEHWLMSRGQPLRNPSGEVVRYVGVVLDITERKHAEEELRLAHTELEQRVIDRTIELKEANRELEKAAKMKDEFLASMSHELRTPLTSILGLSETLQMVTYGELNDKQLQAMHNIETSGRHLLSLINDMLDLSKIEAGKFELQIENCSLGEICQSSLQLTRGMVNQKHQKVSFNMEPVNIFLKADVRRLKQMIVNLLGNAIKFTPDGGNLGIDVYGDYENQKLNITIWDEGIGIRAEDLQLLFKAFVQLDSGLSRQYAGTGLGLSMVQRLAELHNGKVQVESAFGRGSRFTIVLPWVYVTSRFVTDNRFKTRPLAIKDAGRKISPMVLMADDNEMILSLVSDFLVNQDYQVRTTHSGAEFLERLEQVEADVILMDIQMPGMNGIEVIKRIRAHPSERTRTLPIIAITAHAMDGDRERCLEAGANSYMSKPIILLALLKTLEELCPTRQ